MPRVTHRDGVTYGLPPLVNADWAVQQRQALADVESHLFGGPARPLLVSRYQLVRRIASGGAGTVWEARDPELARSVAIKIVLTRHDARSSDTERARMIREAHALATLRHPNIITVYDVGTLESPLDEQSDGPQGVFIVMELVRGQTVEAWMRTPRSWDEIRSVFLAAGRALAHAHAAGIIHRDFKPSNVMLDEQGRVSVLDFGLARPAVPECTASRLDDSSDSMSSSVDLTQEGAILGTPAYMAPEQHAGRTADARADQFAFCVSLFEAVYGWRPFSGRSIEDLARAKQAGSLARPRHTDAPPRVLAVIQRGLAPDPAHRFADMEALVEALDDAGRSARWRLAAAGLAVSLLGIGGVVAFAGDDDRTHACAAQGDRLLGIWDEQVAADVRRSFGSTARTKETHRQIVHRLDEYRDAWVAQRTESCLGALSSDVTEQQAMRRRILCLDVAARNLDAITDVLRRGGERTVLQANEFLSALAPLSSCRDDEELAGNLLPADPSKAAAVAEVRGHLARVRAFRMAHRFAEARGAAEDAVALARRADHPPSLILALYGLGWTLAAEERLVEAESAVREGWLVAEAHGLEELELRGTIDLCGLQSQLGRYQRAAELVALAEAKAAVRKRRPGLEADLAFQRGMSHLQSARPADAVDAFAHALALREHSFGPDHVAVAWTAEQLGRARFEVGDLDGSEAEFGRAHQIYVRRLGPNSLEAHVAALLSARVELRRGRVQRARAAYEGACERFPHDAPYRLAAAECHRHRADIHAEHGAFEEVLADLRAAELLLIDVHDPDHPSVADVLATRGEALERLGRIDEALANHDRALVSRRARLPEDHPDRLASERSVSRVRAAMTSKRGSVALATR